MSRKRPQGAGRETQLEIGPRAAVAFLLLVLLLAALFFLRRQRDQSSVGEPSATAPAAPAAVWPTLGAATAPVTMVVYSDYQCPNCRQFATDVLPWLKSTWLARGLVRLEYRDFAIRGDASYRTAEAAHCAGDQGRYWPYHDLLFASGGADDAFSRAGLLKLAGEAGADPSRLAACLDAGTHRARVEQSTQAALAAGFEGTPTYTINGRVTAGAIPVDRWNALFQAYENDLAMPAP